ATHVSPSLFQVVCTRAISFSRVQAGGQSMGRSAYAANDVPGVASFTASLAARHVSPGLNSTLAAAHTSSCAVQFAGGTGFKVGSFLKAPGAAPVSQSI